MQDSPRVQSAYARGAVRARRQPGRPEERRQTIP